MKAKKPVKQDQQKSLSSLYLSPLLYLKTFIKGSKILQLQHVTPSNIEISAH